MADGTTPIRVASDRAPRHDRPALRRLMQPFAAMIFAKAEALRQFDGVLSGAEKGRLWKHVRADINNATSLHTHDVSATAAEEAYRRGIDDLSVKTAKDQSSFDPGRDVFFVEHMVPISALVFACLHKAGVEGVLDVLTDRLRVVWLLLADDKALTLRGLRRKLPNPDEAYRRAGIRVLSKRNAGGR